MQPQHTRHILATAALLLGSLLPATAADFTATWNGTTGNWSDTTKWSTNPLAPNNGNGGFTFDVVQSAGALTMDQAVNVEKLTMSGGGNSGSGFNLTVNDLLTLSGGSLNGTGTINANGGATINGSVTITGGRVINLNSDTTWSGGTLGFNSTSGVVNTAGNTFTTTFDGTIIWGGGTPIFENAGTFNKSGGTLSPPSTAVSLSATLAR